MVRGMSSCNFAGYCHIDLHGGHSNFSYHHWEYLFPHTCASTHANIRGHQHRVQPKFIFAYLIQGKCILVSYFCIYYYERGYAYFTYSLCVLFNWERGWVLCLWYVQYVTCLLNLFMVHFLLELQIFFRMFCFDVVKFISLF